MPTFRYVPLLKTKIGEVTALGSLASTEQNRIFPVFHLVETPPANFVNFLSGAWFGKTMALDGSYSYFRTGNPTLFDNTLRGLILAGVTVIPSIECDTTSGLLGAVRSILPLTGGSMVIKCAIAQISRASVWARSEGWTLTDIDLVVDLKSVADHDPVSYASYISHTLTAALPGGSPWRSVTLAASAAPKDYTGIGIGRCTLPRKDWLLWNAVYSRVPFQLDYGDYTVSHPDLTEAPGAAMANASVSARYAVDSEWIVHRGPATTGPAGRPMSQTYRSHAANLSGDPLFGGLPACWGDGKIRTTATLPPGPGAGGRPQWAQFTTNRHLSLVANRLP